MNLFSGFAQYNTLNHKLNKWPVFTYHTIVSQQKNPNEQNFKLTHLAWRTTVASILITDLSNTV